MRSTVAYYLMLLYITVMVKPLMPIAIDWWQHEFNEVEHLSHVHAAHGSHHLQHEIADTGTDTDSSKNQNTLKADDQVALHIVAEPYKVDYNSILLYKQFGFLKHSALPPVFIFPKSPPPKFA